MISFLSLLLLPLFSFSSSSDKSSSYSSTSTSTSNLDPIDNKPFFCLSMISLINSRWRCDFNSKSVSRRRISFCWRSTSLALATSTASRFLSISSRVCKRSSSKSFTRCSSFKSLAVLSKVVFASFNSTFISSIFTSTSSGPLYPYPANDASFSPARRARVSSNNSRWLSLNSSKESSKSLARRSHNLAYSSAVLASSSAKLYFKRTSSSDKYKTF